MLPKVHSERKVLLLLWTERRNFRANRSRQWRRAWQDVSLLTTTAPAVTVSAWDDGSFPWHRGAKERVYSLFLCFDRLRRDFEKKKRTNVSLQRVLWENHLGISAISLFIISFFFLCHVYGLLINFITNHPFSSLCNSAKSLSVF